MRLIALGVLVCLGLPYFSVSSGKTDGQETLRARFVQFGVQEYVIVPSKQEPEALKHDIVLAIHCNTHNHVLQDYHEISTHISAVQHAWQGELSVALYVTPPALRACMQHSVVEECLGVPRGVRVHLVVGTEAALFPVSLVRSVSVQLARSSSLPPAAWTYVMRCDMIPSHSAAFHQQTLANSLLHTFIPAVVLSSTIFVVSSWQYLHGEQQQGHDHSSSNVHKNNESPAPLLAFPTVAELCAATKAVVAADHSFCEPCHDAGIDITSWCKLQSVWRVWYRDGYAPSFVMHRTLHLEHPELFDCHSRGMASRALFGESAGLDAHHTTLALWSKGVSFMLMPFVAALLPSSPLVTARLVENFLSDNDDVLANDLATAQVSWLQVAKRIRCPHCDVGSCQASCRHTKLEAPQWLMLAQHEVAYHTLPAQDAIVSQVSHRDQIFAKLPGTFRITNPTFVGQGPLKGRMFGKLTNFVYCFGTANHGASKQAKCKIPSFASFIVALDGLDQARFWDHVFGVGNEFVAGTPPSSSGMCPKLSPLWPQVACSWSTSIPGAAVPHEGLSEFCDRTVTFQGMEDPRAITLPNGRVGLFVTSREQVDRAPVSWHRMFLLELDPTATCVSRTVRLHIDSPLIGNAEEHHKNWAPFTHNGAVYLEYSIHPRVVVKLDHVTGRAQPVASCTQASDPSNMDSLLCEAPQATQVWASRMTQAMGDLHGGAPSVFVPLLGMYLGIAHMRHQDYSKFGQVIYFHSFYLFHATPPFEVFSLSHPFVFESPSLSPQHHKTSNWLTQFAAGLGLRNEGNSTELVISFGDHDCDARVVRLGLCHVIRHMSWSEALPTLPCHDPARDIKI